jgi:hypothetical protein
MALPFSFQGPTAEQLFAEAEVASNLKEPPFDPPDERPAHRSGVTPGDDAAHPKVGQHSCCTISPFPDRQRGTGLIDPGLPPQEHVAVPRETPRGPVSNVTVA